MPQIVSTNVSSLTAQRNLNKSQSALQTSLQRLSSGLRINSAKDDAAGLAISNRFTTQIRGLGVAMKNAENANSYAGTTEDALKEVTSSLQRIRDLAQQSATGTNSDSDRASLQEEVDQLVSEINRIAENTDFNGAKVLNGSQDKISFHIGANANQTVSLKGMDARASSLGSQPGVVQSTGDRVSLGTTDARSATDSRGIQEATDRENDGNKNAVSDFKISIASVSDDAESVVNLADARFGGNIGSASTKDVTDRFSANYGSGLAKSMADRINSARSSGEKDLKGVYATAVTTFKGSDVREGDYAGGALGSTTAPTNVGAGELKKGDLTINGVDIGAVKFEKNDSSGSLVNAINAKSDTTGVQASVDKNGELVLTASDGRDIVVSTSSASVTNDVFGGGDETDVDNTTDGIQNRFSGGFNDLRVTGRVTVTANDRISFGTGGGTATTGFDEEGLKAAGSEDNVQAKGTVANADITTIDGANRTMKAMDSALAQVDSFRATLGAMQNRLDSTIRNLGSVSDALSAANSRIQDADFAAETASMSKNQVLQQAGISVLAQANALPQSALSLLG